MNIISNSCGHGLVVEHELAKFEARVRFSLAAHLCFLIPISCKIAAMLPW